MSFIGLDVGTSRVKAVRLDDAWAEVDSESEATTVLSSADGRREQDPDQVWAAAARVVAAVAGRAPDPVELVALTAQGDGCWLVDTEGEAVGAALLWNDSRAAAQVRVWQRDGTLEEAFAISGNMGAPGLASAQLRWLMAHEPDRLARASRLLSCGGWVYFRMTGRRVLERSDAANPFCAALTGEYDDRLMELFGLTGLGHLRADLVTLAEAVAPLRPAAASVLGLPAGTPVVLAPYDVVATAVGCAAVRPGEAFGVLGTTLCTGVVSGDPRLGRTASGMTLPLGVEGRWLLAYATLTGTEALDWAARTLGLRDAAAVVRLAGEATRADPPLFLPYLSRAGERSPFLDPSIRGGFRGVDIDHGPADLARAVVEGLSLAVLDCLVATGIPTRVLTVCGGGARSDLWCQVIADATGTEVRRTVHTEVGALGAAAYAATAVGMFDDLDEAVRTVGSDVRTTTPRPSETERLGERHRLLVAARCEPG